MATRVRRPLVRARSRKAPGSWARTISLGTQTVAAATKVQISNFVLSNQSINETIRRTRGRLWIGSDQNVASEEFVGAFGMIKASDISRAAGAASLPGPVTEKDDDGWFVWEPLAGKVVFSTAIGFAPRAFYAYDFDSKAMRRIEEGFGVAVMFENASATLGLQIMCAISVYSTRS